MRLRIRTRGEEGAVLIIALVFIMSMGLLVGTLVTLTDTNLIATTSLNAQRSRQYAVEGALETAVQIVRYPTATAGSCGATKSVVSVTIPTTPPSQPVSVWCQTTALTGSRDVTFWACPVGVMSLSDCQSAAVFQAEVLYDDIAPGCGDCKQDGSSLVVKQWTVGSANTG